MKGIIYYTDNELDEPLFSLVQKHIGESDLLVTSSSLKPINFGYNEVLNRKRGYVTMIKQIISCLERSPNKYVFFCEHDVLYHKSHFEFTPPRDDTFYYNKNVWKWKLGSDTVVQYDRMIPLSCMCANRELALNHYKIREAKINELGEDKFASREPSFARKWGYEPGTKPKRRGGLTDDVFDTWSSQFPNIDIRHKKTFSPSKITKKSFKHEPKWWQEIKISEIMEWDLKKIFNL